MNSVMTKLFALHKNKIVTATDTRTDSVFQRTTSEYDTEQHSMILDPKERKAFLSPAPINPFWIQILVNGMLALRDDGKGQCVGIHENPVIIVDSVNYITGELNYKALDPKDHIEVIWASDAEMEHDIEDLYSPITEYFTCKCCGAPGQRFRCSKCKHIPGEREL